MPTNSPMENCLPSHEWFSGFGFFLHANKGHGAVDCF